MDSGLVSVKIGKLAGLMRRITKNIFLKILKSGTFEEELHGCRSVGHLY